MTDLTLEDLAGGSGGGEAAKEVAKETAESGESLMDLIEFMDDRGYLGPLMNMANDGNVDMTGVESAPEPDTDNAPAASSGDSVPLNATNIERLAGRIQDEVGDVPISKIEAFAGAQPEKVNALISQLDE